MGHHAHTTQLPCNIAAGPSQPASPCFVAPSKQQKRVRDEKAANKKMYIIRIGFLFDMSSRPCARGLYRAHRQCHAACPAGALPSAPRLPGLLSLPETFHLLLALLPLTVSCCLYVR